MQVNPPLRFLSAKDKQCQSFKSHKRISVLEGEYEEPNLLRVY